MCQPEVYWLLKQCMLLFSGWQIWVSKEIWCQCFKQETSLLKKQLGSFFCLIYVDFLVEWSQDVAKWGSLVPAVHSNLPFLFPVHEWTWSGWITRHGLRCHEAGHSVWRQARGLGHHQCLLIMIQSFEGAFKPTRSWLRDWCLIVRRQKKRKKRGRDMKGFL